VTAAEVLRSISAAIAAEAERAFRVGLLEGKTALVTGGGTGIGLASAVRLAAEGAHVFVTGRRKTELDAAVEVIGPAATAVTGGISNLADLDRLYATIGSRGQGVDVLFANASGATLVPLEQVTEEDFDTLLGRHSIVLPDLGQRTQGTRYPGQHRHARTDRHPRPCGPHPRPRTVPAATGDACTAGAARTPRGDRRRRGLSRLRESSFITGSSLYVDGGLNQI